MNDHIGKLLHAGISVRNMEEALEWYGKNLGFQLVTQEYAEPLQAKICFLERDGFQLELFEYDTPRKIPQDRLLPNTDLQTVGTKHIAFETDDMKALKERFVQNGVDIAHEVTMGEDAVMFVRDPGGVLIEFIGH